MKKKTTLGVFMLILTVMLAYALSWITTVGIIKLIAMCFGLTFKWSVATGIWLCLCVIQTWLKGAINLNKKG